MAGGTAPRIAHRVGLRYLCAKIGMGKGREKATASAKP